MASKRFDQWMCFISRLCVLSLNNNDSVFLLKTPSFNKITAWSCVVVLPMVGGKPHKVRCGDNANYKLASFQSTNVTVTLHFLSCSSPKLSFYCC